MRQSAISQNYSSYAQRANNTVDSLASASMHRARRAELHPSRISVRIITKLAGKLAQKYGMLLNHDELVSAGSIGWCEAVRRFDESLGAQLSTYAYPYVRGAMLSALRKEARRRNSAETPIEPTLCENPTGFTTDEGWQALMGQSSSPEDPETSFALKERRELLRAALDSLPSRQCYVVERIYLNDRNVRQVSEELGVCETRVRRLRSMGLERLQRWMARRGLNSSML